MNELDCCDIFRYYFLPRLELSSFFKFRRPVASSDFRMPAFPDSFTSLLSGLLSRSVTLKLSSFLFIALFSYAFSISWMRHFKMFVSHLDSFKFLSILKSLRCAFCNSTHTFHCTSQSHVALKVSGLEIEASFLLIPTFHSVF